MGETALVKRLQVALVAAGARVFRNNTGALYDREGRLVRYGLAPGSSDLIGWLPVTIAPAMVGHRVAVFLAVECKGPTGTLTAEQAAFLAAVRRAGGYALIARDLDEPLAVVAAAVSPPDPAPDAHA